MLRLLPPYVEGQEKGTSRRNVSLALSLTPQESNRVRAAIRTLRRAYGGYDVLADVMGVYPITLKMIAKRRSPGSFGIAVLLSRAAGISLEALLSPLKSVGVCPMCGARKGAR
jgi:hypothetical protein